jgi:putative restriction endonuclease
VSLSSFLDLSLEDARDQWRRLRQRPWRRRQEPFLPVETLLCYGLFFILDPHRFGGGNIERLPPEVRTLAATLRRPPGSLLNKMLNLEGSRAHGQRLEPELFLRLARDPGRFFELYQTVLRAAREVGLGDQEVPDFLAAFEATTLPWGQEELGPREIERALQEEAPRLATLSRAFAFTEGDSARLVEQQVRLRQHRFAFRVLSNSGHRCGFCRYAPHSLAGHRLVTATHIKPWGQCTPAERSDFRNGLAACLLHARAFNTGLLTVDGSLRIHLSGLLRHSLLADPGAELYFGEQALGGQLFLPPGATPPQKRYLDYHHRHVFQGQP